MKIRDDLTGVVYAGGSVLVAGDDVPAGVKVGDHLLAAPAAGRAPARKRTPRSKAPASKTRDAGDEVKEDDHGGHNQQ